MEQADRRKFSLMFDGVCELYAKESTDTLKAVYWEMLKHFEYDAVANAFTRHSLNPDTGQFMPKPADIVKMIEGASDDRSMKAWTKVEKAIRLVGPWESVVFDDANIHAVLDEMGGWINICSVTDDELPFRAKEFQTRYRAYAQRGKAQNFSRRLVGYFEHGNSTSGHEVKPPILLGDQRQALLVYQSGKEKNERFAIPLPDVLKKIPSLEKQEAENARQTN